MDYDDNGGQGEGQDDDMMMMDQLISDMSNATLDQKKEGQSSDRQARARRGVIKQMAANFNAMQNAVSATETQATGGSSSGSLPSSSPSLESVLTATVAAAGGDVYFQACVRAVERIASLGAAGLEKCASIISMMDDTDTSEDPEYNPRAALLMNPLAATQHDTELATRIFETYSRASKMVHDRHRTVGDVPLGVLYSFPAVLDHRTISFKLGGGGSEEEEGRLVTQVMLLHHRVEYDPGLFPITALSKHTKAKVAEEMEKSKDDPEFKGESEEQRKHRRRRMRYTEYTRAAAELTKQCSGFLRCIHNMGILYGPMPPRFIYCTTRPRNSMYLAGTLYCSIFNPDERALRPHVESLRRFGTLGEHQLYVSPRIFDDAAVFPAYFSKEKGVISGGGGSDAIVREVAKVRRTLFSADYYGMGVAMLVANLEAGTRDDKQNRVFTEASMLAWNEAAVGGGGGGLHQFYETVLAHADGALREFTPDELKAYREKSTDGALPDFIQARNLMRAFIRNMIMGEEFGGLTEAAVEATRRAAPLPLPPSMTPAESSTLLADSMKRANSHRQTRLQEATGGEEEEE